MYARANPTSLTDSLGTAAEGGPCWSRGECRREIRFQGGVVGIGGVTRAPLIGKETQKLAALAFQGKGAFWGRGGSSKYSISDAMKSDLWSSAMSSYLAPGQCLTNAALQEMFEESLTDLMFSITPELEEHFLNVFGIDLAYAIATGMVPPAVFENPEEFYERAYGEPSKDALKASAAFLAHDDLPEGFQTGATAKSGGLIVIDPMFVSTWDGVGVRCCTRTRSLGS